MTAALDGRAAQRAITGHALLNLLNTLGQLGNDRYETALDGPIPDGGLVDTDLHIAAQHAGARFDHTLGRYADLTTPPAKPAPRQRRKP
jgi:hypothetical protein